MSAIEIGPIVLGWDRFAALAGLLVFVIAAEIIARISRQPALSAWSARAVLWGLVGARLGHVVQYPDVFLAEPWTVFAVWQGGFSPVGAALAVGVVTALSLRRGLALVHAFGALWLGGMLWLVLILDFSDRPPVPAPQLQLVMLDGADFDFTDRPAQPLVVNLWATWCPPCRRELPMLAELAEAHPEVTFLLASQGEDAETVRAHLNRAEISDAHMALDPSGELARHYGTIGLPVTLFLGADGVLEHVHVGEISRALMLRQITALTR